jgi:hypothetical protein
VSSQGDKNILWSAFWLSESTSPSWNNTSAHGSVSSLVSMKYLIAATAPHLAAIFVSSIYHQPFSLAIFACSPCPSHPLEQAHQDGCCEKLPSLLQAREQGGPARCEITLAVASPIDADARPSPPFYHPTPPGTIILLPIKSTDTDAPNWTAVSPWSPPTTTWTRFTSDGVIDLLFKCRCK